MTWCPSKPGSSQEGFDCIFLSPWISLLIIVLFQKATEVVLKPWQKGMPRSSHKAALLYAIIKPAVELVKTTLSHLIAARESEVCVDHNEYNFRSRCKVALQQTNCAKIILCTSWLNGCVCF